jgi:hypothetical protein
MTFPPCETDTWPPCRPLVEWMTSLLPDGGTGLWVPETRLTSCDLPIFMEEAAEPVVAADAGEVGLAVFRERAQGERPVPVRGVGDAG